jgi:hypothetical protein
VPPLHVIRARNSTEYRFYELTGDLAETLHFAHFSQMEGAPAGPPLTIRPSKSRVKLGAHVVEPPAERRKQVRLRD